MGDLVCLKAPFLAGLIVLMCGAVFPRPAGAQDRLPPIPADRLTDAQKKAAKEFLDARHTEVFGPFVPLLRSPDLMNRVRALGDYLRFTSVLPPRLSEFAILITARQWTQQYEWNAHHASALKAGLSPDTAKAVAEGRRPDRLTQEETAVYEICTELRANQSISDVTYQRAVGTLGEQGVIDTVGIAGYYSLLAMVLNTARTPLPPGSMPALTPFPR